MFKYRLISTFVLIPIVIAAIFLLPLPWFKVIIINICVISAWEWSQFIKPTFNNQRVWVVLFYNMLLTTMMFITPTSQLFTAGWQVQYPLWIASVWWLVALLLVINYPRSSALWRKSRVLQIVFGMLTILPFLWGVMTLRYLCYNTDRFIGAWWLFYIMVVIWSADSSAYIFGRILGHYKLAPKISPDKTWEGLISSFIASLIVAWLLSIHTPLNLNITSSKLLICSIIAILASVLGDLTESMFKREIGVKNSSCLIPGHGGLLDRIDSLTAAVPVFSCTTMLFLNNI